MGVTIGRNEIELNSIKYPLVGRVQRVLASVMPEKQVTGDYTIASDPDVSTWATVDQRVGLLTEEILEDRDYLSYWWSTLQTGFRKSFTLPPLATPATTIASPEATTVDIVNAGMETAGSGWTGGAQTTPARTGSYSWGSNATDFTAYQDIPQAKWAGGIEYTFSAWIYSSASGNTCRIGIDDGVTPGYTDCSGVTTYTQKSVTKTISAAATRLRLIYEVQAHAGNKNCMDDATLSFSGTITPGTTTCFCNFNSILYASFGAYLGKLNSGGTGFDYVRSFPATISSLFQDGTRMYVFMEDTAYQSMTTAEAFTVANQGGGSLGIYWDSLVFGFRKATNTISLITGPGTSTPTLTAKGIIPVSANATQGLFKYYDTSGNDIIYASTKEGLFAHDYTNAKWLETQVKQGEHTTGGKGAVVFQEACFISSGLSVLKYTVGDVAIINKVGLDQGDGLPALRNGEIVKFIQGINEFFALIDSTYEGTTSRSSVLGWDGLGWRVWWEATADNKHMYSGIISTDTEQRLWWSTTDGIYFIKLPTNALKPKKNAAYTYATSGTHYTGWFDGGWANRNKLALRFMIKTKGCLVDKETVTVSYRTNHTNVDLATGWTPFSPLITTNTTTTYTFASAVGVEFNAIQFKLVFAQATGSTSSPEVEWFALEYQKVVPTRWSYQFTVDCTNPHGGRSAAQLLDALVTAAATGTLVPLSYMTTTANTVYGVVSRATGNLQTGEWREGHYAVTFLVP